MCHLATPDQERTASCQQQLQNQHRNLIQMEQGSRDTSADVGFSSAARGGCRACLRREQAGTCRLSGSKIPLIPTTKHSARRKSTWQHSMERCLSNGPLLQDKRGNKWEEKWNLKRINEHRTPQHGTGTDYQYLLQPGDATQ